MKGKNMTIEKTKLTPASEVRQFWEEHAIYKYDSPENGGRARLLAVEVEGHLIIGVSLIDFAGKLYSHQLGCHKYCLEITKEEAHSSTG
jgi:hypothetical protein